MIYCLMGMMTHDIIKLEQGLEFKNEKNEINNIYNQNCIEGMKLIP
jgi:hypothetical protein